MAVYLPSMHLLLIVVTAHYGLRAADTEVPQAATSKCTSTTCKHGGLCLLKASGDSFRCNCTAGYWGEFCERVRCDPGEYYDGECHPCPIGTYSPTQGLDERHCLPCPADEKGTRSSTNQAGRTDVSQCVFMPAITRLRPDCGPVSGGTRVLIDFDYLLGRRPVVTDLLGKPCSNVIVIDETTILCETPAVDQASAGPIEVNFGDETAALSTQKFTYHPDNQTGTTNVSQCVMIPVITRLRPDYGPMSGGTRVLLDFEHLNGRQPVNIKLQGKYCTEPFVVDESTIMCKTPNVTHASVGPMVVSWNETATLSTQNFAYRPDPVIRSIDNIKTFISGGMVLRMHGEHLDSVFQPVMVVTRVYKDNIRVFTANHTKKTSTELQFAIPKLTEGIRVIGDTSSSAPRDARRRRSAPESNAFNSRDTHFYLGFRMDGVDEYRNMSTSPLPQYGELIVYNDPVYNPFEGDDQVRDFVVGTDEFIHIRGKHLNYASQIRDVTVTVGVELCNITLLATNQLTCRPPTQKPRFENSNYAPGGIPGVTVYVGTLVYFIGYLNYVDGHGVSEVVIAVVVAMSVAFVVIVGVSLCLMRRRRRQAKDGTVRLRGLVQSHETNLYYVRGFFSDNPSGEYLTGQPSEHGSSLSLSTTPSRGRTMSSSVTPPSTPLTSSIYSGPYPNGISVVLCNGTNTIFNIMDEIDEDTKASVEECLIDSSRLTLGEVIGQGYFGKVYRGELIDYDANIRRTVAVKTVHAGGQCTAKDLASFLSEATLMKDFNHPNVLSLLGLVITYNKPHVILPFMQHGDLKSYIKAPSRSITVRELLAFGVQIANGMCYLAMQKFVHRDLATRNCMVDEVLTVKIADFGLSRDVYRTDYYRVEDKHRPLPVRWMAIESLTLGVFTSKSDVWSYGVALWELLTRGCSPYPDVDSFNIKSYVLSGRRMSQPHHAPDDVYALISRCWQDDPDDRPSFEELHVELRDIIDRSTANNHHEYLQLVEL